MVCSHCWARSWNNWTAMICLGPISVSAYAFTYHYSVWIISICKLLKSKAYFIKSLSCLFLVKSNVWDLYLKDIIIFFFFLSKKLFIAAWVFLGWHWYPDYIHNSNSKKTFFHEDFAEVPKDDQCLGLICPGSMFLSQTHLNEKNFIQGFVIYIVPWDHSCCLSISELKFHLQCSCGLIY